MKLYGRSRWLSLTRYVFLLVECSQGCYRKNFLSTTRASGVMHCRGCGAQVHWDVDGRMP